MQRIIESLDVPVDETDEIGNDCDDDDVANVDEKPFMG